MEPLFPHLHLLVAEVDHLDVIVLFLLAVALLQVVATMKIDALFVRIDLKEKDMTILVETITIETMITEIVMIDTITGTITETVMNVMIEEDILPSQEKDL
jgi:formaldehyde-activating enzyme involved in methanogenesis